MNWKFVLFIFSSFNAILIIEGVQSDTKGIAKESGNELLSDDDYQDDPEQEVEEEQDPIYIFEPPRIAIKGEVIPNNEVENSDQENNSSNNTAREILKSLSVLADTWWKILIWIILVLFLLLLFCYLCKCCYLCWDCCTDPFWGCCPKSRRCRDCLLLRCCRKTQKENVELSRNGTTPHYYQVKVNKKNEIVEEDIVDENTNLVNASNVIENSNSCLEENLNVDSEENEKFRVGEEGLPQVFDSHYFHVTQLFKKRNRQDHINGSTTNNKCTQNNKNDVKYQKKEYEEQKDIQELSNISFGANNKLAYQKKDIVIDHGHMGRYQILPEARSELISVQIRSNGSLSKRSPGSSKRMSRSMESFGIRGHDSGSQVGRRRRLTGDGLQTGPAKIEA